MLTSRLVSHVEYPSLVELRALLLDLVAQLLGALSGKRQAQRALHTCSLLQHVPVLVEPLKSDKSEVFELVRSY